MRAVAVRGARERVSEVHLAFMSGECVRLICDWTGLYLPTSDVDIRPSRFAPVLLRLAAVAVPKKKTRSIPLGREPAVSWGVDFEVLRENRQTLFVMGRIVLLVYLQSYEVVNPLFHLLVTGGDFGLRVSSHSRRIESFGKSVERGHVAGSSLFYR